MRSWATDYSEARRSVCEIKKPFERLCCELCKIAARNLEDGVRNVFDCKSKLYLEEIFNLQRRHDGRMQIRELESESRPRATMRRCLKRSIGVANTLPTALLVQDDGDDDDEQCGCPTSLRRTRNVSSSCQRPTTDEVSCSFIVGVLLVSCPLSACADLLVVDKSYSARHDVSAASAQLLDTSDILKSTSPRIREVLTRDGGLERLLAVARLLHPAAAAGEPCLNLWPIPFFHTPPSSCTNSQPQGFRSTHRLPLLTRLL